MRIAMIPATARLLLCCTLLASPAAADPGAPDHDFAALLPGTVWEVVGREDAATGESSSASRTWRFKRGTMDDEGASDRVAGIPCAIRGNDIVLGPPINLTRRIEAFDGGTMTVSDGTARFHLEKRAGQAVPPEANPAAPAAERVDPFGPDETVRIEGKDVNLRATPSTKGKVVRKLKSGDLAQVMAIGAAETVGAWGRHHWVQVITLDKRGTEGWVFGAFLRVREGCSQ